MRLQVSKQQLASGLSGWVSEDESSTLGFKKGLIKQWNTVWENMRVFPIVSLWWHVFDTYYLECVMYKNHQSATSGNTSWNKVNSPYLPPDQLNLGHVSMICPWFLHHSTNKAKVCRIYTENHSKTSNNTYSTYTYTNLRLPNTCGLCSSKVYRSAGWLQAKSTAKEEEEKKTSKTPGSKVLGIHHIRRFTWNRHHIRRFTCLRRPTFLVQNLSFLGWHRTPTIWENE